MRTTVVQCDVLEHGGLVPPLGPLKELLLFDTKKEQALRVVDKIEVNVPRSPFPEGDGGGEKNSLRHVGEGGVPENVRVQLPGIVTVREGVGLDGDKDSIIRVPFNFLGQIEGLQVGESVPPPREQKNVFVVSLVSDT